MPTPILSLLDRFQDHLVLESSPASGSSCIGQFCGTERVVVHARAPDVAPGLARAGVVDGARQHLGAERQQELEDAVAEVIQVPSGLAEEAVKRTEVFQMAQLPGLNDARERAPAGAENPGAGQRPEGGETGLGKAGLKGEQ